MKLMQGWMEIVNYGFVYYALDGEVSANLRNGIKYYNDGIILQSVSFSLCALFIASSSIQIFLSYIGPGQLRLYRSSILQNTRLPQSIVSSSVTSSNERHAFGGPLEGAHEKLHFEFENARNSIRRHSKARLPKKGLRVESSPRAGKIATTTLPVLHRSSSAGDDHLFEESFYLSHDSEIVTCPSQERKRDMTAYVTAPVKRLMAVS
ncbi:unnamed protein product [Larinioides sclopetarius]|uniref:Uncharacterized protein n=1 Tax=Larinioides sclopetarius TaxID=280406 RepID=A0AAV1ZA78_9ARAC